MAEKVTAVTHSKSKILHIAQRPGQTMKESISSKKAFEILGWQATTSFSEGVRKSYEWFLSKKQHTGVRAQTKNDILKKNVTIHVPY